MLFKSCNNQDTYFINIGNQIYDNRFPAFYESIEQTAFLSDLENNYLMFKNEWIEYIQSQKIKKKLFFLYNEEGWNTIMLFSYGLRYHKNCTHFQKTIELLTKYKDVVTIYFSTLDANTSINPHFGETDATYRVHLGIDVPETLPLCGIEVGGMQKSWENRKTLIFNDAHFHKAWNLSNKKRTVLIIDLIKPNFIGNKKSIISKVLGALATSRLLMFFRLIPILPKFAIKVMHYLASLFFYVALPLQNGLKIIYK